MAAIEVVPAFQPQHEDAEIILERIVENLPSQVFDKMFHSMYEAGGFGIGDYEKIHEKCGRSAAKFLSILRGKEVKYLSLPF